MDQNSQKRILILEDAREDRLRFRYLLEEESLRLVPQPFEFAWAWPESKSARPGVLEWFRQKLNISSSQSELKTILEESSAKDQDAWLSDYSLILLDLAWSADAEREMGKMQLLPPRTGYNMALMADEKFSSGGEQEQRIKKDRTRLEAMLEHVEGIQFLEWWNKLKKEQPKPEIWVTSAYTSITAWELREFIEIRYKLPMYHKWNDEDSLLSKLSNFKNRLKN